MSQPPLNVLVVVDVQNCFMFSSDEKNKNFLNLADKNDSQAIANEIADLADGKNIVVFTRDYHPINHISFEKDEGRGFAPPNTWPRHCRDKTTICSDRNQNEIVEPPQDKDSVPSNEGPTLNNILKTNNINAKSEQTSAFSQVLGQQITGTDLSYFFYDTSLRDIIATAVANHILHLIII